jgi:hypothetical protein
MNGNQASSPRLAHRAGSFFTSILPGCWLRLRLRCRVNGIGKDAFEIAKHPCILCTAIQGHDVIGARDRISGARQILLDNRLHLARAIMGRPRSHPIGYKAEHVQNRQSVEVDSELTRAIRHVAAYPGGLQKFGSPRR